MSVRSVSLRALVTERLTAAAEEIFALVERTIAEYEEELCRSKEENQRKQQLLEQLLSHRTGLKEENSDDPQILQDPHDKVKEEDSEGLPVTLPQEDTSVATETHREDMDVIQIWTIPVSEDRETEGGDLEQDQSVESTIVGKSRETSPKTCSVCNKKFARSCDLKRHEMIHMGVKPYICSVCDRSFFGENSLKVHMRQHTGERPFQCPQCVNKRFGTKGALNLHIKTIHTQVRPFSCSVCDRTFKTKGHLKEHMLRHTEFRPLQCPVCGKGYWRRRELQAHEKRHMRDLLVAQSSK